MSKKKIDNVQVLFDVFKTVYESVYDAAKVAQLAQRVEKYRGDKRRKKYRALKQELRFQESLPLERPKPGTYANTPFLKLIGQEK